MQVTSQNVPFINIHVVRIQGALRAVAVPIPPRGRHRRQGARLQQGLRGNEAAPQHLRTKSREGQEEQRGEREREKNQKITKHIFCSLKRLPQLFWIFDPLLPLHAKLTVDNIGVFI